MALKARLLSLAERTAGPGAAARLDRLNELRKARGERRAAGYAWPNPEYTRNAARLRVFKDRHRGERCFILGNGPSLARTDLSLLEGEATFGLNRIYLMSERFGFEPTYFVAINALVLDQCAQDIRGLRMPKFVRWDRRHLFEGDGRTQFLYSERRGPAFHADPTARGVWEGATVTNVALQLAYFMGFQEVVLLGVDHNFSQKGPANATVVSEGDDPDHFNPRYFGKGFRWQLPDLETSEIAYRLADEAFRNVGRRVLNGTLGGRLEVFQRVDYRRLVEGGRTE